MDVEIKPLGNEDFMDLQKLYIKMGEFFTPARDEITSTRILIDDVFDKNMNCMGLKEDGVLKGFIIGYEDNPGSLHISGIYNEGTKRNLKKMIDKYKELCTKMGYKQWTIEAVTSTVVKIANKYGAFPIYTKMAGRI